MASILRTQRRPYRRYGAHFQPPRGKACSRCKRPLTHGFSRVGGLPRCYNCRDV